MSLDFYLVYHGHQQPGNVAISPLFERNITHNLGVMADEAGIYTALWRPETLETMGPDGKQAGYLVSILEKGLDDLKARPDYFAQFNPENGWGDYDGLVEFVTDVLDACRQCPEAKVRVWR